ncbi:hypothetical protein ACO0QE_003544 [Hanseniaspora vineae]
MSENILDNVNNLLKNLQQHQQQGHTDAEQHNTEQSTVSALENNTQLSSNEENQDSNGHNPEQVNGNGEEEKEDEEEKEEEEENDEELKEESNDDSVDLEENSQDNSDADSKLESAEEIKQNEEGSEQEEAQNDEDDNEDEEQDEAQNDEDDKEDEEQDEEQGDHENSQDDDDEESANEGGEEQEEDEDIDKELMQKQLDLIMQAGILNKPVFKDLSDEQKLYSLIKLINSEDFTAMPNISINVSPPPPPGVVIGLNGRPRPDLNRAMNEEETEKYQEYLNEEKNITSVQYFPPRSRLFIGNLPLRNVTKEDLFRIFYPYGKIMQVNIKNAFGFIQFDNPKSVEDAIAIESQEINFNKQLILEVSSSTARPQFDHGDHGANSSSTFMSSAKRSYNEVVNNSEDFSQQQNKKNRRNRSVQCQIFVKRTADRGFANEVFNRFKYVTNLQVDMSFLKPRMDLKDMIQEAAESGVWGVVLVNKTNNLDISTFYRDHNNEIKYNEYIGISIESGIALFNQLKQTGGATGPSTGIPPPPMSVGVPPVSGAPINNYMMSPPPQQQQGGSMAPAVAADGSTNSPYGNYAPLSGQQGSFNAGSMPPQGGSSGAPPYTGYPPNGPQMPYNQAPANSPPIPAGFPGQPVAGQNHSQQQLLSQLQNLPPQMLSSLLASAQTQQSPGAPGVPGAPVPPQPMNMQPPNATGSNSPGANNGNSSATAKVQSLLDSLAKFQK